jgi:hypothetical protein
MGIRRVSMHVATAIAVVQILTLALSCRHPNEPIPPNLPDTTSHAFSWQEWGFGEGDGYSSEVTGATIVDDSIVYVTGAVFERDSTGQVNVQALNLGRWTISSGWKFHRLCYYVACGQNVTYSFSTGGVAAFASSDLWVAERGPGIVRFDGSIQRDTICGTKVNILCLFPSRMGDLLVGGRVGGLAIFRNRLFTDVRSNTTVDIYDIGGEGDSRWACGYSHGMFESAIIESKDGGQTWNQVWRADSARIQEPFGQIVSSLWASSSALYVASNFGIFRVPLDAVTSGRSDQPMTKVNSFPNAIRGSADNNISVAFDNGSVQHYNGSTWKEVVAPFGGKPLNAIAVSRSLIVAGGFDATALMWKARVVIGRRM